MDVLDLRTLFSGDDSQLNAVIARADKAVNDFLTKPRPPLNLPANLGPVPGAGAGVPPAGGGAPIPPPVPPPPPGGNPRPGPSPYQQRVQDMQQAGYYSMASGAMLTGAITKPLIGLGVGATKFGADFEESMQRVVSLTDVAKNELGGLRREVLELSKDPLIRQAPTQLGDGLYYVTSTGLKGADGMKVLKAAALGASAGLGETSVVANTLTTVLDAYGLTADKAMRATDTLTQAVKFGKGEADAYAAAFPKVIALAAQAGVSFEEVAAQMASATRVGLTPSETATALRQIFSNLIDPSEKAKKSMKDLGTSVQEVRLMLREKGLFNTLKDLSERTGGRIGPITELFGSIRALTGFLSTTGEHTLAEYKKTLDAIFNGKGATKTAAESEAESLNFQLDKLKSMLAEVGIELSEKWLPKINKAVSDLRQNMPGSLEAFAKMWADLPEPIKAVATALGALLFLAGPLRMFLGTAQILVSALLGLVTIAANPVGLVALVAIAGLGAIGFEKLKAAILDADIELHNGKMAAESFGKALGSALENSRGSKIAKTALTKLSEDAIGAEKDTKKLVDLIREATKEKAEIGKDMHLSATGKALIKNDLDRLIRALEARAIELDVTLKPQIDAAKGLNTPGAVEVRRQEHAATVQKSWEERAKAAGVALPKKPEPPKLGDPNSEWTAGWQGSEQAKLEKNKAEYPDKLLAYEKAKSEIKRRIEAIEKAKHDEDRQNGTAAQTNAQTVALNEQTKAVKDLTDAELTREQKRLDQAAKEGRLNRSNADGTANTKFSANGELRARDVETESRSRKDKIQKDWADQKRLNAERAADAQAAVDAATQESAERLLAIQQKRISDALSMWQTFGNSVESIMSGINYGDDEGKTRQLAAQAQMAKREFGGIPPELKRIVLGIAAIGDQMDRLTATRDKFRGIFTGMYQEAIANGGNVEAVKAQAMDYERRLNYENEMQKRQSELNRLSKSVLQPVEARREALSAEQERLNEAKRRTGRTFESEVYVDAAKYNTVARAKSKFEEFNLKSTVDMTCADVASKTVEALGISIKKSVNAGQLEKNVKDAGWQRVDPKTAPMGSLMFEYSASARSKTHVVMGLGNGQVASSSKHETDYFGVKPGYRAYAPPALVTKPPVTEQPSKTPNGEAPFPSPDKVGAPKNPGHFDGKNWVGIPAPENSIVPAGTNAAKRDAAVTSVAAAKTARPIPDRPTASFDGSNLNLLPQGFGGFVTNLGLKPGEQRSQQQAVQNELINMTRKQMEAEAKRLHFGNNVDAYAWSRRQGAKALDESISISKVHDETRRDLLDMGRQIRMIGKENNPYLILLEEFNSGADRLLSTHGKAAKAQMTLGLMVESTREATRQMRKEISDEIKSNNEGLSDIENPKATQGDYERRDFAANTRRDIWRQDDIKALFQAGEALQKEGKTLEARAKFAEANRQATERLRMEMMRFDSQAAKSAIAGTAQAARERLDLLSLTEYTNNLLRGGTNRAEADNQTAIEAARREEAKRLDGATIKDDGTPGNILRQIQAGKQSEAWVKAQAEMAASQVKEGIDTKAVGQKLGDSSEQQTAFEFQMKSLDAQKQKIELMRSEDPELQIQLSLLQKEFELRQRNALLATNLQLSDSEIAQRMKNAESELRAQSEISRLQTSKANALSAQNSLLDLQKEAEMMLAHTAREKLEIEYKYQDILRERQGIATSEEEKAARNAELKQAAANELAQQVQSSLADSIEIGMRDGAKKGAKSFMETWINTIRRQVAEELASNLTGKLFGKKNDAVSPNASGSNSDSRGVLDVRPDRNASLIPNILAGTKKGQGTGGEQAFASATINVGSATINARSATGTGTMAGGAGSQSSGSQLLGDLFSVFGR